MIKYDSKAARDIERSYLTPEIIKQRMQTLEALALRSGERVLDAGCGTGLLVEQMALAVGDKGQVTGVDFTRTCSIWRVSDAMAGQCSFTAGQRRSA